MPLNIDKISLFLQKQINDLKEKNLDNKSLLDRLNTIEKYNNLIDNDYLEDLKESIL